MIYKFFTKKIFNDDTFSYTKNLSSSFLISKIEPEKRSESFKKSNFLQSFKTLNFEKNKSSKVINEGDNLNMTKFLKKVKINLERSLSRNNDKNHNISNNKSKSRNSSSSSEENENGQNQISLPKSGTINRNSIFKKNFIKQQTLFGNKFLKLNRKANNEL